MKNKEYHDSRSIQGWEEWTPKEEQNKVRRTIISRSKSDNRIGYIRFKVKLSKAVRVVDDDEPIAPEAVRLWVLRELTTRLTPKRSILSFNIQGKVLYICFHYFSENQVYTKEELLNIISEIQKKAKEIQF